jgi:iron(II)-dependent oxidoreductase
VLVARDSLIESMAEARAETDKLFALVRPDSLYERPIPERHRIIFYIGHLEAFDWNLLRERATNERAFDPALDQLFAFGIDPVDGGLPSDSAADLPAMTIVEGYVGRVRERLDAALSRGDFEDSHRLLNVAVEHRLMHAETLAYMLHQLPVDQKIPQAQAGVASAGPAEAGMIEIPAGPATLGLRPNDDTAFGWDNEYNQHVVDVPAFRIDRFKVTNGQYLGFLRSGGFEERSQFTSEDWRWKRENGIEHPVFWVKDSAGGWRYRTMFGTIPLPLDWPVYVSYAEASAYAKWAGKRLPTEAEWHRAAYGSGREFPWGDEKPSTRHGYFDFARWDPSPVNAFPGAKSPFAVEGLMANGWEWTSTKFAAFEGFEAFPFYEGYSANFFDEKHYVMKGGSTRTAKSMLRASFRNWFQPHYQYVYAGFRCAEDLR